MKARNSFRITALLVSVLLIASMLPAGTFAKSADKVDDKEGSEVTLQEEESAKGDNTTNEGEPANVDTKDGEHVHSMEFVEKVEASCQKSGMKAYYYCAGCDKLFYDKNGENEVENQEDLIIPIKEHDWDEGHPSPDNLMITIFTCKNCGTTKEVDDPGNFVPGIKYPTTKKMTLDGYTLKFQTPVVSEVMDFMDKAKVDHVWLKAAKAKMTINWKTTKAMKGADGLIVLRKTGSQKAYKEIAQVKFKTYNGGVAEWNAKTKYNDKTASKKNTPYSYIVVAYLDGDDQRFISHCSDWAAGQTTTSKLKTVNTAALNKKKANLQYKGTDQLTLTYENPKTTYNATSFRWYTDDKKIAKVNSKGKVTATGVGSTKIRGRLSSGDDIVCKVNVVGAFKPSTPKLKVDVASETSITLVWSISTNATSYDLYRSDDGLHWKDPVNVKKKTTYKFKNLVKNHRYTFYIVARNDNHGYSEVSDNSNVVNQKAVIKRRPTTVKGFPKKKTLTSGSTFSLVLKITSPDKRKASLQMYVNKKWVTKKTIKLPAGAGNTKVTITFPNDWWSKKSEWRLVIPKSNTSEAYTSPTLTITTNRRYQNPKEYIQISNTISKHGYNHYIAPVLIDDMSTRSDCIEALIKTANKYKGDDFVSGRTGAPGYGIDAGGLVIEACYGAGIDLWPVSPSTRKTNAAPEIMNAKLKHITNYGTPVEGDFPNVYRGDLIFFNTGKNSVGHVAIYLGLGKIIHASMVSGKVETANLLTLIDKKGKYKYTIAGVRRVFV